MAAKRGANGRFAGASTATADDLPPLIDLEVEPVDMPAADWPPLPPPPEPPSADADGDLGGGEVLLADALAGGINELVGLLAGAQYKAQPAEVEAVGEAAAPVVRRALTLIHAESAAESTVPAWVRELATLAARAYVAWGDGFVLIARERVAELRAQREVDSGAQGGSTYGGDGGVRAAGGANGPGGAGAGQVSAAAGSGEEIPPVGLDPRRAASIDGLIAIDSFTRRRRPD